MHWVVGSAASLAVEWGWSPEEWAAICACFYELELRRYFRRQAREHFRLLSLPEEQAASRRAAEERREQRRLRRKDTGVLSDPPPAAPARTKRAARRRA